MPSYLLLALYVDPETCFGSSITLALTPTNWLRLAGRGRHSIQQEEVAVGRNRRNESRQPGAVVAAEEQLVDGFEKTALREFARFRRVIGRDGDLKHFLRFRLGDQRPRPYPFRELSDPHFFFFRKPGNNLDVGRLQQPDSLVWQVFIKPVTSFADPIVHAGCIR